MRNRVICIFTELTLVVLLVGGSACQINEVLLEKLLRLSESKEVIRLIQMLLANKVFLTEALHR